LYGSHVCGAGWLVTVPGRPDEVFGDGEPSNGRNMTEAVWLAQDEIRRLGYEKGEILVFAAGGERMARITAERLAPYYGDLTWELAPVYTISMEAILEAAEKD
jgi:hypothetical protein